MKIDNYDEIFMELKELILQFQKDQNQYQTDVYLYIRDGKGELDTFINVGGNSWWNDDHITIYIDHPHYEGKLGMTDEEWSDFVEEDETWHYAAVDALDEGLAIAEERE